MSNPTVSLQSVSPLSPLFSHPFRQPYSLLALICLHEPEAGTSQSDIATLLAASTSVGSRSATCRFDVAWTRANDGTMIGVALPSSKPE